MTLFRPETRNLHTSLLLSTNQHTLMEKNLEKNFLRKFRKFHVIEVLHSIRAVVYYTIVVTLLIIPSNWSQYYLFFCISGDMNLVLPQTVCMQTGMNNSCQPSSLFNTCYNMLATLVQSYPVML